MLLRIQVLLAGVGLTVLVPPEQLKLNAGGVAAALTVRLMLVLAAVPVLGVAV